MKERMARMFGPGEGRRLYEVVSFSMGNGFLAAAVLLGIAREYGRAFVPPILGFYVLVSGAVALLGFSVRGTRRAMSVITWSAMFPIVADIGVFLVAGALEVIPWETAWRVAGTIGTFLGAVLFLAVWRMIGSKS